MRVLPPWDANRWFFVPTTATVQVGISGDGAQLCQSNPMRVGLVLSNNNQNTNSVYVAPNSDPGQQHGINLPANGPTLLLTHHDWGALVQCEWWAAGGSQPAQVYVTELVLRDWPQPDPHQNADVVDLIAEIAEYIRGLRNGVAVPR